MSSLINKKENERIKEIEMLIDLTEEDIKEPLLSGEDLRKLKEYLEYLRAELKSLKTN